MKLSPTSYIRVCLGILFVCSIAAVSAQTNSSSPSMASTPAMPTTTATAGTSTGAAPATGMPDPQEMMKQMMELAKTNENHKILADLAGNWTYKIKFRNPATGKWEESGGTAVRKNL